MKKTLIKEIKDAFILEIEKHEDHRGFFQETFSVYKYTTECWRPAQINISCSKKHVIRGLHVAPFSKLCTCIRGRLFDVVADCRKNSDTFGNWFGVWLDENSNKQVYVPAGCAHGFYSAQDDTMLLYQQDFPYTPSVEKEINWKDSFFSIEWPHAEEYILSEKDAKARNFDDFEKN